MKVKKIISTVALVLTSAMLVACGSSNANNAKSSNGGDPTKGVVKYTKGDLSKVPETAKKRKNTIVIGQSEADGVFNPLFMSGAYDFSVANTMFDRLMNEKKDGTLEKNMVDEFKISDDGLKYTYKLKKGLKWSDGTPITSKDIEMYIKVCADPSYDGDLTDFVSGSYGIVGAKEYQEGKANNISGINLVDDQTIEITLTNRSSSAQYDFGNIAPVPTKYYEKYYVQGDLSKLKQNSFTSTDIPVSGAYKLTKYTAGGDIEMVANDNYFKGKPKIKNLIYRKVTQDTVIPMLKSGEIDIAAPDEATLNQDNISMIESAGFLNYVAYPTNGYGWIGINHKNKCLSDKTVRQALTIGLNREKINKSVFDDYAKVLNIPQSNVSWVYSEPENDYKFNLEKAKKMLDEAGWKLNSDGIREKDGVKLEFTFTGAEESEVTNPLVSVATENWKKLGVKFKTEIVDFNTLISKEKTGDYDMFFMAYGIQADPTCEAQYATTGNQNYLNYSNKKLDEIFNKLAVVTDKTEEKELYKELYKEWNEDLPVIPVYQRCSIGVYNSRVKGLVASPYEYYYNHLGELYLAK